MNDYDKIWLDQAEAYQLRNNPNLVFYPYRDKRNELRGHKAQFKNLEFYHTITNKVFLSGSLHKYKNEGVHNYDDFTAAQLQSVTNEINQRFKIRLQDCQMLRFEFGVNIKTAVAAKNICEGIISIGKTKAANTRRIAHGTFTDIDLQYYRLKIYDKGKQYDQGNHLLRFEIHAKKKGYFKKLGVSNFGDLLRPEVWPQLKKELQNTFDKLLLIDPLISKADKSQLTPNESKNLNSYLNKSYWHELINFKDQATRKKFSYHKKNFERIGQKLGANTKANLIKSIGEKWDELTKLQQGNSNKELGRFTTSHRGVIRTNEGFISELKNKAKESRICPVTGLNISMQRQGSFLLSHAGLRYYLNTDRKVFNEVKRKYLSEKWQAAPLAIQVKELAHNIRNTHNNNRNREKQKYPPGQTNLLQQFA